MFKLDTSSTYFFPVTVEQPADGGKFVKSTFDAEFKRLSKTEVKSIFERLPGVTKEAEEPINDDDILTMVFVGWKGVADASGDALPYSETTRVAMLDIQGVSNGIVKAFFDSISGSKVTKN